MAALCLNANALTLTQADIDILINDSNSNLSADDVEGYIPGIQQLTLAYKANVGGSDEGHLPVRTIPLSVLRRTRSTL